MVFGSHTPRLPNHPAEPAPSTVMYWSKAPVYGHLPNRCMRGHSITLIENMVWQIAGCDTKGCYADVLTFDTETMYWAHPETVGDIPTPFRAHSATAVERRIFVFGGGSGMTYYNDLYVLDTAMRRWTKINYPPDSGPVPIPRRAHATWYFQGKLYLFGGGNGVKALNDVWTLDVNMPYDMMKWEYVDIAGPKPAPRGYHTANLVNDTVIVIGGSDGQHVYDDVWMLYLPTLTWHKPDTGTPKKRLGHSSTPVGSYLFVIGGHDGSKYNHELQLFNLVTSQWEARDSRGRCPTSRGYHASVLTDSRIFVFGGFDGSCVYDDVYILDLAAAAYLPQVTSFSLLPPKLVPQP
ncbi:galactose oxidase [Hysterangium stoloniferum]|nr:galactose oxidase [Hysterangium stoloniferum]